MDFRIVGAGAFLAVAASGFGCSDGAASGGGGQGGNGTGAGSQAGITFHRDVEPILQQSCLGCHRVGQIGEFSLESYEDVKTQAGVIAAVTAAGIMPPFPAKETDECQPRFGWRNDWRLSADEIAVLKAWSDAGAPEGDPADAPPPYQAPSNGLPSLDQSMTPVTPVTVEGTQDKFVCVVYDPALLEDRYLDGINIVPGNAKVAHHALLFRAARSDMQQVTGGSDRFDCFGGPPGELIHAWAPGMQPLELASEVGIQLTTDQVIVVQMHYHPTGESVEQDASTVELRYHDSKPPWSYNVALPGNESSAPELLPGPNDNGAPQFRIPANVSDHVEEMAIVLDLPAGLEVPIYSVGTHMHYVGTDARFWIERPVPGDQPAEECMVHTPQWDFNWQMFFAYDAPISELPRVRAGDVLHLRCKYNNSMSNPFLAQALADRGMSAPVDVWLGEETLDEMCLVGIGYLLPF